MREGERQQRVNESERSDRAALVRAKNESEKQRVIFRLLYPGLGLEDERIRFWWLKVTVTSRPSQLL